MIALLGRKLGMTQLFDEKGVLIPATVLEVGPCYVTQIKQEATDGYRAVQIGFGAAKERALSQAEVGHLKKAHVPPMRHLTEFRLEAAEQAAYAVGQTLTAELFAVGDRVDVIGTSIGKGFQGGMKRWHWKGGGASHGSMGHRQPGSIGSNTFPGRVWPGHHLPGHMGARRVTTQQLQVMQIIPQEHVIALKGHVPGAEGAIVVIRKSKRQPAKANAVAA